MAKTKIVVLQTKEIVYTGIFVALGIFLLILLLVMFLPKKNANTTDAASDSLYKPGIYTSELILNDTHLQLEVAVDASHINSVSLTNLDETVKTMYPLMEPTIASIEAELVKGTPIDEIETSEENPYTQEILLDAVSEILANAKP